MERSQRHDAEVAGDAAAEVAVPDPEIVLEPLADFPRIDLRAGAEPWEKRHHVGKGRRESVPHAAHAVLDLGPARPDPVALIEGAHEGRQQHLIPLRVARMATSPFAFLRGAAHVMAWDLAQGPRSGIDVVMNGDAHIANFGLFGTPQRDVVLDLNDFDEVTVGPWEWDLKRLVAGIEIATRDAGTDPGERRGAVVAAVAGYQRTMRRLAPQGSLDVWYQTTRPIPLISQASAWTIMPAAWSARRWIRRGARTTAACWLRSPSGAPTAAGGCDTIRRSSPPSTTPPARR